MNEQRLEANTTGNINALTTVQKDNLLLESKTNVIGIIDEDGYEKENRVYGNNGVAPAILQGNGRIKTVVDDKIQTVYRIRKLTPKECWRLMGFTDEDFEKAKGAGVSNSQLYKQAGNSIVKQVLMALFSQMNIKGVKAWNSGVEYDN